MPISTCIVSGNVRNLLNNNVLNCAITVSVASPFFHPSTGSWISGEIESTSTDSSGNFSLTLIETASAGQNVRFTFSYFDGSSGRKVKQYSVVIPNQASADLSTLIGSQASPITTATFPASQITVVPIVGLAALDAQAAFSEIIADITGTASRAAQFSSSGTLQASTVTSTELAYVHGVTSSIQTQINTKQASGNYITALTGDVTAAGPGSVAATIASVGGSTAANVHTAELIANAATNANTASAVVKRDGSGNFTAGTITATLTGNATNVSGTVAITNGGTGQVTANAALNAFLPTQTSNSGKFLSTNATNSSWATAVTSVGLSLPSEITVTNSPVTTTGTLTGAWATQTTNKVFAAPNGSTGTPGFRALATADMPNAVAAIYTSSRTDSIASGGTLRVRFDTLSYDSNSLVTTGASWAFTAPSNGIYSIVGHIYLGAGNLFGQTCAISAVKNGTPDVQLAQLLANVGGGPTAGNFSGVIKLAASDTLYIQITNNGGFTVAQDGTANANWVGISRVGAY